MDGFEGWPLVIEALAATAHSGKADFPGTLSAWRSWAAPSQYTPAIDGHCREPGFHAASLGLGDNVEEVECGFGARGIFMIFLHGRNYIPIWEYFKWNFYFSLAISSCLFMFRGA